MQHVDVPVPSPEKDEVLLKLEAASLNPVDWKMQKGMLRPFLPRKFPYIPGKSIIPMRWIFNKFYTYARYLYVYYMYARTHTHTYILYVCTDLSYASTVIWILVIIFSFSVFK